MIQALNYEVVNKPEIKAEQHLFGDNYFGSICLLKKLSGKAIACKYIYNKKNSLKRPH